MLKGIIQSLAPLRPEVVLHDDMTTHGELHDDGFLSFVINLQHGGAMGSDVVNIHCQFICGSWLEWRVWGFRADDKKRVRKKRQMDVKERM